MAIRWTIGVRWTRDSIWTKGEKLSRAIYKLGDICRLGGHWQTKQLLLGLRPGRPVDDGPQEGDYSAWVAWEKGKVETRKTSQGAQLFLSSRLPR